MTFKKRTLMIVIQHSRTLHTSRSLQKGSRKIIPNVTWNHLRILYEIRKYLNALDHRNIRFPTEWTRVLHELPGVINTFPSTTPSRIKSDYTNDNKRDVPLKPTNLPTQPQEKENSANGEKKKYDENVEAASSFDLPLIGGWRSKNYQNQSGATKVEEIPSWRTNQITISASSNLKYRTLQLLSLIEHAESVQSRVKRIEDFNLFLLQNPESRRIATKAGGISKLLRVERITKDLTTHRILRETFSTLGYFGSLPCKGIRILSIDGGGIRGIAVIELLKKLEQLTGKKIYELFDFICGVSTGSILVTCVGTPNGLSLDEAMVMYEEFGTKLFTQSAFWGMSNLVLGRAYYDTTMFEELLDKFIGQTPLIKTNRDLRCPRLASVSAVMNQRSVMPFVFRNYALPCDRQSQYLGSCKYTLFEAVRASGAAPTVFQEFNLDGIIHQDGGLLVNNPCALAIHEAKLLWPDDDIQCVVSCGTGRHAPIKVTADSSLMTSNMSSISWKTLFNRILESATDTEGVHTMLNDLLPQNTYYRFNPYLTNLIPMHENNSEKISQLREETALYIRRNEEKFVDAAQSLLIKRTATQRIKDFVNLKKLEYRFSV